MDPVADGTDALNAAIDDVKSSLDAALDSASAELQPQIDDVETAFASLQDAVTGLTADNLTQKAATALYRATGADEPEPGTTLWWPLT